MQDRAADAGQAARWGALVVAAAAGLAIERGSDSWSEPVLWVPDLLVGLVLVGAGLVVPREQPAIGTLLGLAGAAWFLGTLWPAALFLHVGVIVHLLVTAPAWRPRSPLDAASAMAAS